MQRMKELQDDETKEKLLRLSIEAGGCSGFQYNFELEDKPKDDDRLVLVMFVKILEVLYIELQSYKYVFQHQQNF